MNSIFDLERDPKTLEISVRSSVLGVVQRADPNESKALAKLFKDRLSFIVPPNRRHVIQKPSSVFLPRRSEDGKSIQNPFNAVCSAFRRHNEEVLRSWESLGTAGSKTEQMKWANTLFDYTHSLLKYESDVLYEYERNLFGFMNYEAERFDPLIDELYQTGMAESSIGKSGGFAAKWYNKAKVFQASTTKYRYQSAAADFADMFLTLGSCTGLHVKGGGENEQIWRDDMMAMGQRRKQCMEQANAADERLTYIKERTHLTPEEKALLESDYRNQVRELDRMRNVWNYMKGESQVPQAQSSKSSAEATHESSVNDNSDAFKEMKSKETKNFWSSALRTASKDISVSFKPGTVAVEGALSGDQSLEGFQEVKSRRQRAKDHSATKESSGRYSGVKEKRTLTLQQLANRQVARARAQASWKRSERGSPSTRKSDRDRQAPTERESFLRSQGYQEVSEHRNREELQEYLKENFNYPEDYPGFVRKTEASATAAPNIEEESDRECDTHDDTDGDTFSDVFDDQRSTKSVDENQLWWDLDDPEFQVSEDVKLELSRPRALSF